MNWDHFVIAGLGILGGGSLATQAAAGTLDIPATLAALTALITAFALAAAKIWAVMSAVNRQLKELLDESEQKRKKLETEIIALPTEVRALRQELEQFIKKGEE